MEVVAMGMGWLEMAALQTCLTVRICALVETGIHVHGVWQDTLGDKKEKKGDAQEGVVLGESPIMAPWG